MAVTGASMEKQQCKVCGQLFSENEGYLVFGEAEESYFLCDGCGHDEFGKRHAQCAACGSGQMINGVCGKCGAQA
jgi:ribosomal protein L37E